MPENYLQTTLRILEEINRCIAEKEYKRASSLAQKLQALHEHSLPFPHYKRFAEKLNFMKELKGLKNSVLLLRTLNEWALGSLPRFIARIKTYAHFFSYLQKIADISKKESKISFTLQSYNQHRFFKIYTFATDKWVETPDTSVIFNETIRYDDIIALINSVDEKKLPSFCHYAFSNMNFIETPPNEYFNIGSNILNHVLTLRIFMVTVNEYKREFVATLAVKEEEDVFAFALMNYFK